MTTNTLTILETNNPDWGFFGTIHHRACPRTAWPLAFRDIILATDSGPEAVRDFLDSRHGRHFADDVANGLFEGKGLKDAIRAAVARWMGWRTGRSYEADYGIPRGLPVLTGLVTFYEIEAEALA